MANNSIMVDLDDPQTEKIAEVISNKTAKKILSLLAENEMSGSEIASQLGLPLNTVTYNLKNLVDSGLVEKSKRMFWSSKGKRMELYKIVNKRIVISPKRMIKGIVPAVLISVIGALGIKLWTQTQLSKIDVTRSLEVAQKAIDSSQAAGVAEIAESITTPGADTVIESVNQSAITIAQSAWLWFIIGALFALLIYLIWNWKKK